MDDKEIVRTVATGGMISVVAGLIRALYKAKEPIKRKIRILFMGVLLGTLASFVFRNWTANTFLKEIMIAGLSSFASTLWPLLERWYIKFFKIQTGVDDDLEIPKKTKDDNVLTDDNS